jgi:predicted dehydrogenase
MSSKLRIGLVNVAHMHVWSYVGGFKRHPDTEIVGVWDSEPDRLKEFAEKSEVAAFESLEDLLAKVDAVAICSENNHHADLIEAAAKAGKQILCEKPLVAKLEDATRVEKAVTTAGVKLMVAFPCRFSPAYRRLKARVRSGEIGKVVAICATNRGRCPFGWFVQPELSGGGSMIDHVVHVTDLLRDLLGEEPVRVQAQTGNNVYSQEWEDTAMVTIEFPSGIFATLDSSWSRPSSFKTWGDVTMTVVGSAGLVEMDMFGSGLEFYHDGTPSHTLEGFGSDMDAMMVDEFVSACLEDRAPLVTMHDGLQAARVAIAGYASVTSGQPVAL